MTGPTVFGITRRFLAGEISRDEAVELILAVPDLPEGLALSLDLSPEDAERLNDLSNALGWEMARRAPNSRVPDVDYGSQEYQKFLASVPRADDDGAA